MIEIIDFLKKYTEGKQNTEKVEMSVFQLNRVIKALEHQNDELLVACDLMNGAVLYGIDYDKLFDIVLDKDDIVCDFTLAEWIEENLDRFSDDDEIRHKAIERLGF